MIDTNYGYENKLFNSKQLSELTDNELEQLWIVLEDVTLEEGEGGYLVTCSNWLYWDKGTEQEVIWKDIDTFHSKGIGWVYENIELSR